MKIKKMLALALTVAMVLSMLVMPASAASLSDIADHWAKDSIERWVDAGVIGGYPDGSFNPNGSITRAEFATILAKAFGLTGKSGTSFSDVERDNHWAKDYIYACAAAGIVGGYPDGTFGPDKAITRQEAMKMYTVALQLYTDIDVEDYAVFLKNEFVDADQVGDWAYEYAVAMVTNNAMQGSAQGSGLALRPTANISRAEVAVILDRVLAVYVGAENQISTTTEDQSELRGRRIVVHPAATAAVTGDGEGNFEVSSDADTLTINKENESMYLMCGDYAGWIWHYLVELTQGDVVRYYERDLQAKYIQTNTYTNSEGAEVKNERVTEFLYNEDTWNMEAVKVTVNGELESEVYAEFNDDGQPVEIIANGVTRKTYEYNEDGMLAVETEYDSDGEFDCKFAYTYDEDGNIIESVYSYMSWLYYPEYDEEGNCIGEAREEHEYTYISKYTYDAEGRSLGYKEYDEDGFLCHESVNTYDENGERATHAYINYDRYYGDSEDPIEFVYSKEEYTYVDGNEVLYTWKHYDHESNEVNSTKRKTVYDEQGRNIQTEEYGKDDVLEGIEYREYDDEYTGRTKCHYYKNAGGVEEWKYEYTYEVQENCKTETTVYSQDGAVQWKLEYKYSYETDETWETEYDADDNVLSTHYSYSEDLGDMYVSHDKREYADGYINTYDYYYHVVMLPENYEYAQWDYYYYY